MDTFKYLDKAARTRIIIFLLIIVWGIFCASKSAYEIRNLAMTPIDKTTADVAGVTDAAFTLPVMLFGFAAETGELFVTFIKTAGSLVFNAIYILIPILLFKLFAIKPKDKVSDDEYKVTRYSYLVMIGVGVLISLFINRFLAIVPLLLLHLVWAMLAQIYLVAVKKMV